MGFGWSYGPSERLSEENAVARRLMAMRWWHLTFAAALWMALGLAVDDACDCDGDHKRHPSSPRTLMTRFTYKSHRV